MPREPEERPVAEVVTSAPDADLTVVADADLVTTAVRTSEALFDSAQLVVVAGEGDPGAVLLGASTAVGLGVPLLIEPQSATPGADPVGDELERLGAVTVLGVGAVSDHPGGTSSACRRTRPSWSG